MSTRQKDGSSQHIFSQKGRAQTAQTPQGISVPFTSYIFLHHHLSPLHPHSIATAGRRADRRFRAFRGALGGGAAAASGARGADSAEEAARSASAGEGTTKLAGNLGSLGETLGLGEPGIGIT